MPALAIPDSSQPRALRPSQRSFLHMTVFLLLLGVALFGAMAGYVIFCDRV